jgi:hypothetical protein
MRKPTKWDKRPRWATPVSSQKKQTAFCYTGFDTDQNGFTKAARVKAKDKQ